MLNRTCRHTIRKIHCLCWLAMSVQMDQESRREHIASTCRVHLIDRISRETLSSAILEECSAVSAISGNQQWYFVAPISQNGISFIPVASSEWEQIIVTQNEHI